MRSFDWKYTILKSWNYIMYDHFAVKRSYARSYTFHDRTVPSNRSFQRKQSRLKVKDHQWESCHERYTKIYDPQAEKVYDHQGSILQFSFISDCVRVSGFFDFSDTDMETGDPSACISCPASAEADIKLSLTRS